uniref:RING-type domain-containing protein n=1 Tax=Pyramimonas orientalis virus TaxID=455367 RepID=A0A7M3UNP5_POV01|nr:hypothetical protein HWQ62_00181 [Pyramimonas orientalis virus]
MSNTYTDDCVICLDEILKKDKFVLGCSHSLHIDCFKIYFEYNYDIEQNKICCPICRDIINVEQHVNTITNNDNTLMIVRITLYLMFFSFSMCIVSFFVSSLEIK